MMFWARYISGTVRGSAWAAAAVMVLLVSGCGRDDVAELPPASRVTIRYCDVAPTIDGMLTDDIWSETDPVPLAAVSNGENGTSVRFAWNERYLFIGFECQDMDAAASVTGRDESMVGQDHVTVVLDADADPVTRTLFEIAPTGAVHDAFLLTDPATGTAQPLDDWDCDGFRSSVSVYGGGARPGTVDRFWTVEMAIPFSSLVTAPHRPPMAGDRWLMDCIRHDLAGDVPVVSRLAPVPDETAGPIWAPSVSIVFEK